MICVLASTIIYFACWNALSIDIGNHIYNFDSVSQLNDCAFRSDDGPMITFSIVGRSFTFNASVSD